MLKEEIFFADAQEHCHQWEGDLYMPRLICHLARLWVYEFYGFRPIRVVDFGQCDLKGLEMVSDYSLLLYVMSVQFVLSRDLTFATGVRS